MPIAHIYNGELGFDVRTKLNALIDQVAAIPTGGGTGDVVGPASALADAVAIYNGTSGKLIKDGGQTIANIIASAVAASGTGDVVGPASAVNDQIAVFNGITGKLIQDGGMTIADVIAAGGPGGGTAILDGSGAPSSGTGAAGDYYVDNDDNIMYGPKAAPGAFGPDQSAIPPATTPAASGSGSYEVGARVVAAVAGEIYAVRYWRYTTTTQVARTVNVWTTGGTLLSSGSVANDGGGSGWKQITLTTPVAVAASGAVFVSVDITNTYGETSSPGFPISNGGDISITTGSYSTTPGTFPGTTFGNNFFVDAVFHVPVPTWPVAVDGDAGAVGIGTPIGGGTSGSILYVDGSSNLAQQNANLYFDDANDALKIGSNHTYNIDTFRALYRVPNVLGDNWFEGDAGNPTVSGYNNFGTGSACLLSLTTGYGNTGVGTGAMTYLTTGYNNFGFGTNSLRSIAGGHSNVAVGPAAMQSAIDAASNVALGVGPLSDLTGSGSTHNIAIGTSAFFHLASGLGNIAIGRQAGENITSTNDQCNTIIGFQAGSLASGFNPENTLLGVWAGRALTGMSKCTIIGAWPGPASSLSNVIAFNDGSYSAEPKMDYNYSNAGFWSMAPGLGLALRGATSGTVKINTKVAAGAWTLTLPDSAGTSGYVLSTDGAGVTSWAAAGGGGGMSIGGAITGATAGRVLFAGVGGILDDDSTFTWNDSLKDLAIGGAYYVSSARALYVVPHITENNWFEGNAGNQTMSGYGNFGTGDLALSSVTTGYDNVAVGTWAGKSMTSGFNNFALGSFAMWFGQTDSNNIAIGQLALATLGNAGAGGGNNINNVAIGYGAFSNAEQGFSNIAIGANALNSVVAPATAASNTIIGRSAGASLGVSAGSGSVVSNTFIGANAGYNVNGASTNNTFIGGYQGPSAVIDNLIAISTGASRSMLDFGITTAWTWSMSFKGFNLPTGLHIYNTNDALGVASNYERVIIDWVPVSNVCVIRNEAAGSGVLRMLAFGSFPKAGAPAAGDLPASSFAVIDDTSAGQTWLVFNKAGTIRKVQLT